MTIKTVCALTLKQNEIFGLYTGYEIYPLASMFADSDDDALISYVNEVTSKYIDIQECGIMEVTLECGETLHFYRLKGKSTIINKDIVNDYLVINVPFIDS